MCWELPSEALKSHLKVTNSFILGSFKRSMKTKMNARSLFWNQSQKVPWESEEVRQAKEANAPLSTISVVSVYLYVTQLDAVMSGQLGCTPLEGPLKSETLQNCPSKGKEASSRRKILTSVREIQSSCREPSCWPKTSGVSQGSGWALSAGLIALWSCGSRGYPLSNPVGPPLSLACHSNVTWSLWPRQPWVKTRLSLLMISP